MVQMLKQLWHDEEAPTAVEYAIMVVLIGVAIIGTVTLLGGAVNTVFDTATDSMTGGTGGTGGGTGG